VVGLLGINAARDSFQNLCGGQPPSGLTKFAKNCSAELTMRHQPLAPLRLYRANLPRLHLDFVERKRLIESRQFLSEGIRSALYRGQAIQQPLFLGI
jgi:hypothetical protein